MTDQDPSPLCPQCGALLSLTQAADGSDDQPQPGSVTVCIHCSTPLQFNVWMRPQKMTPEDLAALPQRMRLRLTLACSAVTIARARFEAQQKG